MDRKELKEIIHRILKRVKDEQKSAPSMACVYGDGGGCDMTTLYAIGEEG